MKVAFIINPFSSDKNYHSFLEELKKNVKTPNFYISESKEGTSQFIKDQLEHTEVFVAVGGDGTISTVAQSLIFTNKILAIFPAGSGNGFSNETHFSKDIIALLQKIEKGDTKQIDTFTINQKLSINVSGTGFDGKVVKEFEKTNRGFKNYIKVTLKTFFSYQPIQITFTDPQYSQYNNPYLMLNVANTRQFGNNAYIAPMASKSDGKVDLVLVKKFPIWYSFIFAYRMFTKKLKADQYITYLSVSEISFDSTVKDWHIDGEYEKIESPIHIKVLPKSLTILI